MSLSYRSAINLNLVEVEKVGRIKPELNVLNVATYADDERVTISPAVWRTASVEEQTVPRMSIARRVDHQRVCAGSHAWIFQRVVDPYFVYKSRCSEVGAPPRVRFMLGVKPIGASDDAVDRTACIFFDGLPLRPLAD